MQLENKHVVWIFDAAYEHFNDLIKETEVKIMLHERFKDEPFPNMLNRTREYKVEELKHFLAQYRVIVQFCLDAKMHAVEVSAKEFAQWFKPSL